MNTRKANGWIEATAAGEAGGNKSGKWHLDLDWTAVRDGGAAGNVRLRATPKGVDVVADRAELFAATDSQVWFQGTGKDREGQEYTIRLWAESGSKVGESEKRPRLSFVVWEGAGPGKRVIAEESLRGFAGTMGRQ
ncbi:hypothetical protein [Paenibacillus flagellatus]|uniref:hypothetical protein n=1 Tax=Paenibacillus flagellatus TaxID=2211139 RepID=UPI0011B3DE7B|nr:hypothetical protein [Paenibacillus flagellatus]